MSGLFPTRRGVRLGLEAPDLLLDPGQLEIPFACCGCRTVLLEARRSSRPLDP
jgi:hypothetical protein